MSARPRAWGLFLAFGGAGHEIQRDDDACARWLRITDDDAVRHARRRARRGDGQAMEALAIQQRDKPAVRVARRALHAAAPSAARNLSNGDET